MDNDPSMLANPLLPSAGGPNLPSADWLLCRS